MVHRVKEISANRFRESYGRYFEDFEIGHVYEHRPGKTITEYDNHMFTLLTLNTHPVHFDREFGEKPEFRQRLVVSAYTLSLLIGMSVSDCSQKAIANLGMEDVRFTAPVFSGDTLYAESEVLDKRETRSREGQGIVTIVTRGHKKDGTLVCSFKRSMLIPLKGYAIEDQIDFY